MDGGSSVTEHQDELGLGEDAGQVGQGLEGEGVLVTEPGCGLTVTHDDLAGTQEGSTSLSIRSTPMRSNQELTRRYSVAPQGLLHPGETLLSPLSEMTFCGEQDHSGL